MCAGGEEGSGTCKGDAGEIAWVLDSVSTDILIFLSQFLSMCTSRCPISGRGGGRWFLVCGRHHIVRYKCVVCIPFIFPEYFKPMHICIKNLLFLLTSCSGISGFPGESKTFKFVIRWNYQLLFALIKFYFFLRCFHTSRKLHWLDFGSYEEITSRSHLPFSHLLLSFNAYIRIMFDQNKHLYRVRPTLKSIWVQIMCWGESTCSLRGQKRL